MAIPLIQNVEKQDINTSIIAIKKELQTLQDKEVAVDIDLSDYVKKDDVADVVEADNLNPVTSNAVAQALEDLPQYGTPLGTWASFETDYAPNIEWLQGGTTFNPNTYPALAMYLGGNTVPERFDHNRLGDAELITVEYLDASTSSLKDVTPTSFTTIAYDGEIEVNARFIGNEGLMGAYLNDKYIAFINIYGGGSGSPEYKTIALSVKKGDRLCLVFNRRYTSSTANTWLGSPYVQARYYKHPLFIKATPTSSDSDYEGTLNAIRTYVSNSIKQLPHYPDYASGSIYTTAVTEYTCPEDCYVVAEVVGNGRYLQIDGVNVSALSSTGGLYFGSFSGYVKKGSIIKKNSNTTIELMEMKVFKLLS